MATALNLSRVAYLDQGKVPQTLDYLSAKYLNIKYIVPARQTFIVNQSNEANAPGIAFEFYGSKDYWWVVCMFNGILDPVEDIKAGTNLQLPSLADINAFLSLQESQAENLSVTI